MIRPWHTWAAFGVCSVVVLGAMAWISGTVLRLERGMRGQAHLEENVRLALWRIDSALAPFITQESARPYFTYTPFYPAERAYTRMFAEIEKGDVLVPSPILVQVSPWILVHFQAAPDGLLTSPQVPTGNMRDLAESAYTTHESIDEAARRLAELRRLLKGKDHFRKLEATSPPSLVKVVPPAQLPQGWDGQMQQTAVQKRRSAQEFQARAQSYRQVEDLGNIARMQRSAQANDQAPQQSSVSTPPADQSEGGMEPLWADNALLLARRVVVEGRTYTQGCCLDWPRLGGELLESIQDLLPEARLEPATGDLAGDGERRLAALPVRLVPGPVPDEPVAILSPIRVSLLTSWACALLAALAVATLLRGVLSLSERRRVFVSAVTHELRTPLTTFRMYTDMLADGMVRGEEKRQDYIRRLRGEAERLGHLVENVLFYARLESGRAGATSERVELREFLERVKQRLQDRVERAGMRLVLEAGRDEGPIEVDVDVSALEQVVVNLVDNACKYAAASSEPKIQLQVERAGARALVRVRDRGPGISPRDRQRLFRAFSKSDREAANSAPGVGLGLALSQRLARALGGELQLEEDVKDGASFRLTLPLAGGISAFR